VSNRLGAGRLGVVVAVGSMTSIGSGEGLGSTGRGMTVGGKGVGFASTPATDVAVATAGSVTDETVGSGGAPWQPTSRVRSRGSHRMTYIFFLISSSFANRF
jgi:hypothetical protein